jgi:Flp pilus assembly protein TadG
MRTRTKGQSLVEMAFILPILLMVMFGIIDLGYYIYGYSTIYFAARNGTEIAHKLPPYPARLNDGSDACTARIRDEVRQSMGILTDFNERGTIAISYPTNIRRLGEPIQVEVSYSVRPLTPLFQMLRLGGPEGEMPVTIQARRSIEALGDAPPTTANPNAIRCEE